MLIFYTTLAAVMAASFQLPYSAEALVVMISLTGIAFYYSMGQLLVGLAASNLNPQASMQKMLMTLFVNATGVAFLFTTPYVQVAYIAIPWMAIALYANGLVMLIKLEVLDIRDKDE